MRINRDKTTLSNNRWAKYAAAGAAGAVAALGPQASVDADFTWVELNSSLVDRTQGDGYFDVFGPYTFGASGASFVFQQAFNETASGEGQLTIVGNGNISIAGFAAGAYFYPSNIAYGAAISAAPSFGVTAGNRGDMAWGAGYASSQFLQPGLSFVGFRFDVGNGTQYGFAEVIMDGSPLNTATLVGIGYGMAGDVVTAGQRPTPVIPEPGSLGILALGSLGLAAWRRKRSA